MYLSKMAIDVTENPAMIDCGRDSCTFCYITYIPTPCLELIMYVFKMATLWTENLAMLDYGRHSGTLVKFIFMQIPYLRVNYTVQLA